MTTKHPIAIVRHKAGKVEIFARFDDTVWHVLERDHAGNVTPAPITPQSTRRGVTTEIVATYGPTAEMTMRGMDWFMRDPDGAARQHDAGPPSTGKEADA